MTALGRSDARLEHRLTSPNASLADLERAVSLAVEQDVAALLVDQRHIIRTGIAGGHQDRHDHREHSPALAKTATNGCEKSPHRS